MELPIRDEFFTIHCKISVVDLSHGPDVDVDVAHVLKMEDPSRLKNISHDMRTTISSQSKIHDERRAKGGHVPELGTHHVSEESGHFQKQIEELEHKLKSAHRQAGGQISEHEAGVQNQNLHKQLEAKEELCHSMEKRMKELEGQVHHLESTCHQQKESLEHQKQTMDEHLLKMEEAAKLADHRAKEEMEKLAKIVAHGGEHHVKKEEHHGEHHEESHHSSTHVELSLSYDASHEMVVHAMVSNMKRMHELDTHRIKELTQRV